MPCKVARSWTEQECASASSTRRRCPTMLFIAVTNQPQSIDMFRSKSCRATGRWYLSHLPRFSRSAARAPLLQHGEGKRMKRRGQPARAVFPPPLPALFSSVVLLRAKGARVCFQWLTDGNLTQTPGPARLTSAVRPPGQGPGSSTSERDREATERKQTLQEATAGGWGGGIGVCERAGLREKPSLLVTLRGLSRDLVLTVMAGCSKKRCIGISPACLPLCILIASLAAGDGLPRIRGVFLHNCAVISAKPTKCTLLLASSPWHFWRSRARLGAESVRFRFSRSRIPSLMK